MPGDRLPMRKIREILRLRFGHHLSKRQIAPMVGAGPTAVGNTLRRFAQSGLGWPLPDDLGDAELEWRLFPPPVKVAAEDRPHPEWGRIHAELRRPGVTLMLLWEEYRTLAPTGFGYSWFCETYRAWAGRLKPTMRQVHIAGEKAFVDFSGKKIAVVDPQTGEVQEAEIFVGVLGASSYTWACAVWTQGLPDWIAAHVRMLEFFGRAPKLLVPDNLKAAVHKPSFYDPAVNRTYAEMARHYGIAVAPARPYRSRDKAKVEVGVQVVQRWILARLRKARFFSLAEVNAGIASLLDDLNDRPMKQLGRSRRQLFEMLDRPAMLDLPAEPFVYAEWKRCRVGLDYHVEVLGHYYSVPHALLRQEVEARITARTVEIFCQGNRVASHLRTSGNRRHTTVPEHMPAGHRAYAAWTPERLQARAAAIGSQTAALVAAILASRRHPEQGFRACVGILRLAASYDAARLEAACARALAIGTLTYTSVASILKTGFDRAAQPTPSAGQPIRHANLRGPRYFH